MTYAAAFPDKDPHPDRALIQNRLTVAAMALAALVFSGSFSLALARAVGLEREFQLAFLHIEVALAVGITLTLVSMAGFLLAQHAEPSPLWWPSSISLFAGSQVLLYLALSQALSAALTEVVYGVARGDHRLGRLLGIAATPAWLLLLVVAPVIFIVRLWSTLLPRRRFAICITYVSGLLFVLGANGEAYRVQDGAGNDAGAVLFHGLEQFVQPLTWPHPWPEAPVSAATGAGVDSVWASQPTSVRAPHAGGPERTAAAAAIGAAVIALFALAVSFWQLDLSRRHNKLSVTPHLRFDVAIKDGCVENVRIRNAGVGPAALTGYRIKVDADTFGFEDWQCLDKALAKAGLDPAAYGGYVPDPGEFLAVGEEKGLFRVRDVATGTHKDAMEQARIKKLRFVVQYKSVYGISDEAEGPVW